MSAFHRVAAVAFVALALAGCGGNRVSAPVTPPASDPAPAPGGTSEHVLALIASGPAVVASLTTGIARSTDQGDTWSVVHLVPAYQLAGNGSALFAATPTGMLRSRDDGSTWERAGAGLPAGASVSSVAIGGGAVFAALPMNAGLYRSTDLGESWTKCELPGDTRALAVFVRDRDVFVSALDRHVYRSTDYGLNWVAADDGLPAERCFRFGASAGKLFAGTSVPPGLYVSSDDGASWSRSDSGLPLDRTLNSLVANDWGLFACSAGGLFRSADDGASWTRLPVGGQAAPQVRSLVERDGVLFAGTGGNGVFRSRDNGATWAKVSPTGLPPEPVIFPADGDVAGLSSASN